MAFIPIQVRFCSVNYIAVYWLPQRASLTDFRNIGFYEDPENSGQPGTLSIKEGDNITEIDIYADWNVITKQCLKKKVDSTSCF